MTRLGALLAWVFGWTLAVAIALRPALARAEATDGGRELAQLFPSRAPIEPGDAASAALWRLELTAEVLAACRPDLSDLRILDAHGEVVPFAIDPGPPPRAPLVGIERRAAVVQAAKRRQVPASNGAAARLEETFELEPPGGEGPWQLVIEADAPEFVRELVIEGVRSGEPAPGGAPSRGVEPSPAVERPRVAPPASEERAGGAAPARVEGSLFRIRGLADEQLASALPAPPHERLVVQLAGEELFPLRPRFFFERGRPSPEARLIAVPLVAKGPSNAGGERRFTLARPAGIVPSALRLDTSTLAFERRVEVFDVARGRPAARIGAATVFRMPFVRLTEGLEIELAAASGQALEVRLKDGDNPALAELGFSAVVRAPSLVFAPPATHERGLTLYFGGGRARAPSYDLARLASEPIESSSPGGRGARVRVGAVADNPQYARTPPLAFARRPGAPVDARLYSHQRPLAVAPASEGLARVVLGPADLGVLRADLGDIRVVDAAGRQWPYLIDREPGSESVALELGVVERRGGASRVPLLLPSSPLAPSELVLDASDAYFDRDYHVTGESPEGERVELARGRLQRDASAPREPIVIPLAPARVTSLALEVGDADDSPIAWTSARARIDVPRLYVLAEPGAYRLLLGNALDAEPRYDVARARDLILAVAFEDTAAGPLQANPDYRSSARLTAGDGPWRVVLWLVLALAVAALGVVTWRLARVEGVRS